MEPQEEIANRQRSVLEIDLDDVAAVRHLVVDHFIYSPSSTHVAFQLEMIVDGVGTCAVPGHGHAPGWP